MFCPNCGTKIEPGEKFCSNCGSQLNSVDNQVMQNLPSFRPTTASPVFTPNQMGGGMVDNQSTLKNMILHYSAAACMLLAIIFILFNIGGNFDGIKLIKAVFDGDNWRLLGRLDGDEFAACMLLIVCHLGILIVGPIGITFFVKQKKSGMICGLVILASILGILSGIIVEWNVAAEITSFVAGIIAASINAHIPDVDYDTAVDQTNYFNPHSLV